MTFYFKVPEKQSVMEPYFDVGDYHMTITTKSTEAQTWFNRGLVWTYSFNHEEACRCFLQCIAHDSDCGMAYWGFSYASGPNYNKTWAMFDRDDLAKAFPRCHKIAQMALSKISHVSQLEKALIEALQKRYPSTEIPNDFDPANKAYADAMRGVHNTYKDHLDVVALFADALMNWKPRKMFNIKTGKPITSSPVFEVREVLERGMAMPGGQRHAGISHLYIHLMERSDEPEAALPACDIIRDLIRDAGHMYHMPTHIDILVGEYGRSISYNHKATLADDRYFAKYGGINFYSFYRLHDYHSLIYACMLAGQKEESLKACDRMEATITEEMLTVKSPPMADWLEFFLAVRIHIYIRFGMWQEILDLGIPENKELYCVTTAMTYYGKGIAYASLSKVQEADAQRLLFREAARRVPDSRLDYPNRIVDVLRVATAMLDGEIEYRRRNFDVAFEALREAIKAEDALIYTEPWGWMVPARHPYGALSLEQGMVEQAATAYAQDLGLIEGLTRGHQHPRNVWALHGYYECLVRLERAAEAIAIKNLLNWTAPYFCKIADPHPITTSRFDGFKSHQAASFTSFLWDVTLTL
ncbi:unnamed protein product [Clonostachys byssicola]|uniref:Uncharacterized protein n=1 Tax=Clonostachys byssicola TaxID=160290 RepID=A0A9N9UA97_9HYPO|nr:unnamed protein product [Clonostachys byssicola]